LNNASVRLPRARAMRAPLPTPPLRAGGSEAEAARRADLVAGRLDEVRDARLDVDGALAVLADGLASGCAVHALLEDHYEVRHRVLVPALGTLSTHMAAMGYSEYSNTMRPTSPHRLCAQRCWQVRGHRHTGERRARVAEASPVPVQMWRGWAQSRCKCG
jgi:hypothetical protein